MPLLAYCSKRETLFLMRKFYIICTYFRSRFCVNWFWRGLIEIFNKKKPSLNFKGMAFSFFFSFFFSPKKREKKKLLDAIPSKNLSIVYKWTSQLIQIAKLQIYFLGFFFVELGDETKVSATSANYFFGYKMAQNGHILRGREKKSEIHHI